MRAAREGGWIRVCSTAGFSPARGWITFDRLPNAGVAVVADSKLKGYLMSAEHPSARDKAAFFTSVGFGEASLEGLRQALLTIGRTGRLSEAIDTRFGSRYVVDVYMTGPTQRSARVRTVWIVESGEDRPRLVTAYPAPRG